MDCLSLSPIFSLSFKDVVTYLHCAAKCIGYEGDGRILSISLFWNMGVLYLLSSPFQLKNAL